MTDLKIIGNENGWAKHSGNKKKKKKIEISSQKTLEMILILLKSKEVRRMDRPKRRGNKKGNKTIMLTEDWKVFESLLCESMLR